MKEKELRQVLLDLDIEVVQKNHDNVLLAHCPFAPYGGHKSATDETPAFYVWIEPMGFSGFFCFSCRRKGLVSSMVKQLGKCRGDSWEDIMRQTMQVAAKETPERFEDYDKIYEPNKLPEPINASAHMAMYDVAWEVKKARMYLKSRGISERTASKLELMFDDEFEEQRILFPMRDWDGNLHGFSGRSIMSDEWMKKINIARKKRGMKLKYRKVKDYHGLPKEHLLLGEHLMKKGKPQWLVEGLFAYAHCHEIGVPKFANVLASLGNQLTKHQVSVICNDGNAAYLCYDPDDAGDIGLWGRVDESTGEHMGDGAVDRLISNIPVMIPRFPKGVDDVDNLTTKQARRMFRRAQPANHK